MTAWRTGLFLLSVLAGHAQSADLPPEFWDRPRSAQTVLAQPVIRQAVAALQSRSDARLLLVHGAREESRVQAEELRAWLVALAVEGARVRLRADPAAATIRLEIVD